MCKIVGWRGGWTSTYCSAISQISMKVCGDTLKRQMVTCMFSLSLASIIDQSSRYIIIAEGDEARDYVGWTLCPPQTIT